jgi:phosphoribosylaminoimidazole-succinocarboxamide synthase
LGEEVHDQISTAALKLYESAAEYALTKGLILADTKFEFGIEPRTSSLILIDELLTPDSSRYWPAESYKEGASQPSFDKQFLRDWLVSRGFKKGLEAGHDGRGWTMSVEVVEGTGKRYEEAVQMLTCT